MMAEWLLHMLFEGALYSLGLKEKGKLLAMNWS
jgi:hypothetical protein